MIVLILALIGVLALIFDLVLIILDVWAVFYFVFALTYDFHFILRWPLRFVGIPIALAISFFVLRIPIIIGWGLAIGALVAISGMK